MKQNTNVHGSIIYNKLCNRTDCFNSMVTLRPCITATPIHTYTLTGHFRYTLLVPELGVTYEPVPELPSELP